MTDDTPHILVVDDDDRLRKLLQQYLTREGFIVSIARDAADARSKLSLFEFDVIVLDLMMPGESGLDFAADFRKTHSTPILMLTAMGEPEDRIKGLEAGAEDYLAKPFEPRELSLRLQNIVKYTKRDLPAAPTQLKLGDYIFDADRRELLHGDDPVKLTTLEADMLCLLSANVGEVLSREELADVSGTSGGERAIDVQVNRLRRKFESDPKVPRYLQTVRGRGYVLKPD